MDDNPLDERLHAKWAEESSKRATMILLDKYLSPEGKQFVLNARELANRPLMKGLIEIVNEWADAQHPTLKAVDMAFFAAGLLIAAIASEQYDADRQSWEN